MFKVSPIHSVLLQFSSQISAFSAHFVASSLAPYIAICAQFASHSIPLGFWEALPLFSAMFQLLTGLTKLLLQQFPYYAVEAPQLSILVGSYGMQARDKVSY
jgi:hypothetical protein